MNWNTMSAALYRTPQYLRRLTETDLRILELLIERGPLNQYKISKGIDADYPTAHKAIKKLEEDGFVKFEHEEVTEKGGRAKVYSLTLKGFTVVIGMGRVDRNIDKAIMKWSQLLPLVLGKWDYFKAMGLEDEILEFLRSESGILHQEIYIDKDGRRIWPEDTVKIHSMARFRNFVLRCQPLETAERWLRAIRGDPELRGWAIDQLKGEIARAQAWIKIINRTLKVIEMAEEPDWDKVRQELTITPAIIYAP